tara:strand:+ start:475 stop:1011 length:537 start_codon:yes stop_codon:yes gene_type:complete
MNARDGIANTDGTTHRRAFTLVELMVVVAILMTMAMFTIPMIQDGRSSGVNAAAGILQSDLERAQVMAMSHPDKRVGLQIDADGGGWSIVDADFPSTPLLDEFSGAPISIRLGKGRGQVADGVQIQGDEASGNLLVFGALGGLELPGNPRLLTLRNESHERSLRVSPATGWISIVQVD